MSEGGRGTNERGRGAVANALSTRRRRGQGTTTDAASSNAPSRAPAGPAKRKRNRAKTGKRSNPDYKLAPAYVQKRVHDRAMQALKDAEVRASLVEDLEGRMLRHRAQNPTYSDLVELLLLEWLESVGWEPEG